MLPVRICGFPGCSAWGSSYFSVIVISYFHANTISKYKFCFLLFYEIDFVFTRRNYPSSPGCSDTGQAVSSMAGQIAPETEP